MATTYCPRCGTAMETRFVEGRDRQVCPACAMIFYRNPVPAVATIVEHEGGIVLVRRRLPPRAGLWALPAGFMELGETTEEAALRECAEETGIAAAIEELIGVYSFSEAPGHSGIVIIYAGTAVGGQLGAADDAEEVAVFDPDHLPHEWAFRTHEQALERWRTMRRRRALAQTVLIERDGVAVRLARALDEQAALQLIPLPETDREQLAAGARFHDRLHAPDAPVLVAEHGGALVGLLALSLRQTLVGWEATIDHLRVAGQHQRQGIGAALLEAAEQLARERGASRLLARPLDEEGRAYLHARRFTQDDTLSLEL